MRVSCRRGVAVVPPRHLAPTHPVQGGQPRATSTTTGATRDYDVVAQLDGDHVPDPGLPAGDGPAVRRSGRRLCGRAQRVRRQCRHSRGRPAGACTARPPFTDRCRPGHNDGLAPLCIGSHYAVRTARPSGHRRRSVPNWPRTSRRRFLLNSAGWQGAFAIDAEAHGDGPHHLRGHGDAGVPVVAQPDDGAATASVPGASAPHALADCGSGSRYALLVLSRCSRCTTIGGLAAAAGRRGHGHSPGSMSTTSQFLLHWWADVVLPARAHAAAAAPWSAAARRRARCSAGRDWLYALDPLAAHRLGSRRPR